MLCANTKHLTSGMLTALCGESLEHLLTIVTHSRYGAFTQQCTAVLHGMLLEHLSRCALH
jgi:hypothetical protein